MAKETAEQKLLKMMQKGSSPVAAKSSLKNNFKFSFSIQTLNQLLFLGIVLCIVALVFEMRSGFSLLNQTPDFSDDVKAAKSLGQAALPSSKSSNYYLDQVNDRNIFKPFQAQVAKGQETPKGLAAQLGKYKLVGVAWLDLPETASIMIEDTSSKTTYFLKQGEQLEGVTVKTIYTDRAVLSYENEETTIKL
jgi:hypothetical protein